MIAFSDANALTKWHYCLISINCDVCKWPYLPGVFLAFSDFLLYFYFFGIWIASKYFMEVCADGAHVHMKTEKKQKLVWQ